MKKRVAGILSVVLASVAAGYWMQPSVVEPVPAHTSAGAEPVSFDASAPINARIAALEQAVSMEREARQLLQEEVLVLTDEIERLATNGSNAENAAAAALAEVVDVRRNNFRRRNSSAGRAEPLVAAGFTQGEADWIIQRESELQMEGLRARYDAEREGTTVDFFASRQAAGNALRQELGDADYERYLEANGRSTRIGITTVLENSPALVAGLQAGDEIVNYDGQRVFSMADLTRQTMQGEAGQTIVVDIMRNGVPMQLVLPRGPVGITGGRRFR